MNMTLSYADSHKTFKNQSVAYSCNTLRVIRLHGLLFLDYLIGISTAFQAVTIASIWNYLPTRPLPGQSSVLVFFFLFFWRHRSEFT